MGPPLKPVEAPPSPETVTHGPVFHGMDDELKAIISMVGETCKVDETEVEVRLGWLVNCNMKRIKPPWAKSSVVVSDPNVTFDARVSEQSFYKVNQELNKMVEQAGAGRGVSYKKTKTYDLFTRSNERHELDETFNPVASVIKRTSQTIDMYNPRQAYDLRFKASTEKKIPLPTSPTSPAFLKTITTIRVKERRSYAIDCFIFDLTTIDEYAAGDGFSSLDLAGLKKKHKLEIEVELQLHKFKAEKTRAAAGNADGRIKFNNMCKLFLDNVRGLTETASAVLTPTLPVLRETV
eukprot:TRINITY_DN5969_c0_g1_i2.p1 TRINITY_DN5969_c0_g1~~TRINITY_DN5969_c0_g1_i2.p1  ORF type:complete len:293 (+),score=76.52 TRINITY_DN5969_c0_g1_i2:186-1064(+)